MAEPSEYQFAGARQPHFPTFAAPQACADDFAIMGWLVKAAPAGFLATLLTMDPAGVVGLPPHFIGPIAALPMRRGLLHEPTPDPLPHPATKIPKAKQRTVL
jgi:hypothetical protein